MAVYYKQDPSQYLLHCFPSVKSRENDVATVMFAGCYVATVMFAGCYVAVVMFSGCHIAMVIFAGCHVAMVIFAGCREGVPGEGYETWSRDHRIRAGAERRNYRHGNARDGQDQPHDPRISQ